MANGQTINEFLLYTLGLRVTNRTWAWDAYGDDVVVMKLWKRRYFRDPDGIERIEVWAPPPWKKPAKAARNERRANIDRLKVGGATYAVLREGEGSDDPNARDYEDRHLYKLARVVTDVKGFEFAMISERVSVGDFLGRGIAIEVDLADIATRHADNPTTREALVAARLGQGKYRSGLLARWGEQCAVTGCPVTEVLRASHARPWSDSDDSQRLDPDNGLPLVANLDALFDAGLIAFTGTGAMLVSPHLPKEHRAVLGVPTNLRKRPSPDQAKYLQYHAENVFRTKV
jgi:putative restriction endonuclease